MNNTIATIIASIFTGIFKKYPFHLHNNISSLNLARKIFRSSLKNLNTLNEVLNSQAKQGHNVLAFRGVAGIGDMLRLASVITAIKKESPDLIFDIYVGNLKKGEFAFSLLPKRYLLQEDLLHITYNKYDAIINISDKEPFISIKNTPLTQKMQKTAEQHKHLLLKGNNSAAKKEFIFQDVLALTRGFDNKKQTLYTDIKLEPQNFVNGKYITLHHGWDSDRKGSVLHNKSWPLKNWKTFVDIFKTKYPNIKVVQLGLDRMPYIDGCIDLRSKTTLGQASSILKGALLHIDCDCGFVHIAHNLKKKAIVLFGPTNANYVGYSENINIVSPHCSNCWDLADNWDTTCPKGYKTNKCMHEITPAMVFNEVTQIIK